MSENPVIKCGPGRTKQSMKDECDINRIMARYRKTGALPMVNGKVAVFGDFSNIGDYHAIQDRLLMIRQMFDALPIEVRDRCNYQPEKFIEFVNDEKNHDELKKLGLIIEKEKPKETEKKGQEGKAKEEEVK